MKDTFRMKYKPLTDGQKHQMEVVKTLAGTLEKAINDNTTPDNGREMSVAKTQLETAIMWAVKGITK